MDSNIEIGPDSLTHEFISSLKNPVLSTKEHVDFLSETFNNLHRGSNLEGIRKQIKNMIGQALKCGQEGHEIQESQYLADIFSLVFYFRDYQFGPGYRDVSYWMILELWTYFPKTSLKCLHLFTEYGGWMDILHLLELVQQKYSKVVNGVFRQNPEYLKLKELEDTLLELCISQTKYDLESIQQRMDLRSQIDLIKVQKDTLFSRTEQQLKEKQEAHDKINISLWGKWSPSENGKYHWIAVKLASRLYGHLPIHSENGDILYPCLNQIENDLKKDDSVENQKKYKISLRSCLKKYRKDRVKLNKELETVETLMCSNNWEFIKPHQVPRKCFQKYKNTFLNIKNSQTNRLECTLNFRKYLESNQISFKQLSGLRNLISPYLYYNIPEDLYIENKWEDIVSSLGSKEIFKNMILVSDFSIEISTGSNENLLGLFLLFHKMINIPKRNIIYSKIYPHWLHLDNNYSLKEKIIFLQDSFLIGDTNFEHVFKFILNEHNISEDNQIVLFSDNSFQLEIWKNIDTNLSKNKESPFSPKINILYWASHREMEIYDYIFDNFQIQVIQGFNYYLLTHLIKSDFKSSSKQLIHTLLNASRYNKVRDMCSQSQEGKIGNYQFKNDWITLS